MANYQTRPTTRNPVVADYEKENFGPAMKKLTPAKQAYLLAIAAEGWNPKHWGRVAMSAGISSNERAASVWASRTRRDPEFVAAMIEETKRRQLAMAPFGQAVIEEIAMDTQHKDRFKAASALLDRGGMPLINEQRIVVEHTRSTREILEEVRRLAAETGDEGAVIAGDVIEGEFKEVDDLSDMMAPAPEDDLADLYA